MLTSPTKTAENRVIEFLGKYPTVLFVLFALIKYVLGPWMESRVEPEQIEQPEQAQKHPQNSKTELEEN